MPSPSHQTRYCAITAELATRNQRLSLGRLKSLSLEPVLNALGRLEFDRWRPSPEQVTVVAGTNGKGSVAATIDALLGSAGVRTGLFTSPHLLEPTERIRLSGKDCDSELFIAAYEAVEPRVRDLPIGQFDLLTLMATWLFFSGERSPRVEHAVMEIGMGGTFDPVNALPHALSVITPISIDHEEILGPGIERIAEAKLGVIRPGNSVVHAPFPSEAASVVARARGIAGTRWMEAPSVTSCALPAPSAGQTPRFRVKTPWGEAPLALAGKRGAENAALALQAFQALGFRPEAHLEALSQVRWPGRMQRLDWPQAPCAVYVSGDHNESGMRSLAELLSDFPRDHLWVLWGVTRERNPAALWSHLEAALGPEDAYSLVLTEPPFKAHPLHEIPRFSKREIGRHAEIEQAMALLLERAGPRDLILVTGSLYLVGEAMRLARR